MSTMAIQHPVGPFPTLRECFIAFCQKVAEEERLPIKLNPKEHKGKNASSNYKDTRENLINAERYRKFRDDIDEAIRAATSNTGVPYSFFQE